MEILPTAVGSCPKENIKIYQEWFKYADADDDGRITGNDAIKFFALSKLTRPELKQVWAIADTKRQGFLGFSEFVTAMQVISLAQLGHEISPDVVAAGGFLCSILHKSFEMVWKTCSRNTALCSMGYMVRVEMHGAPKWCLARTNSRCPLYLHFVRMHGLHYRNVHQCYQDAKFPQSDKLSQIPSIKQACLILV